MSVLRQLNLLSQMRLDVPHLRTLDSSVAGDFDTVIGRVAAGERALVVRGFTMSNVGGVAATALELNTADAILYNLNASESGSFLWVPSDRTAEVLDPTSNGAIDGSWTSSAVNYVGLDLLRSADSDTTDIVQFKDANTGLETPRSVPTAKTLDYRIVISTTPFASQANLVPIAKVTLNGSGVVTAMSDSRNMMFRLGRGGDSPDAEYAHSWAASRAESTALDNTLFVGADKAISSEKEWMDSIMTRLWELGGGEYWYSATSDRNCTQVNTGTTFSNGEYFDWDETDLLWKDLVILFDNSTAYYNTVSGQAAPSPGLTDLADGECIYVEVDRATDAAALTAQKGDLATLSAGTPPGSMWVIAWRYGTEVFTRGSKYAVGNWISVATTTSTGIVKLSRAASTPNSPIVISDKGGTIAAPSGSNGLTITVAATGTAYGVHTTGSEDATSPGAGILGTGGAGTGAGAGGTGVFGAGGEGVVSGGSGGYFAGGLGNSTYSRGGVGGSFLGGLGSTAKNGGDGVYSLGRGTDGGYQSQGIYRVVHFDNQTVAFTPGATLTGGTSGATGLIVAQYDAGATGFLQVRINNGKAFVDNETITDGGGGSADVNLYAAGGNGGVFLGGDNTVNQLCRQGNGIIAVGGDNDAYTGAFSTALPTYPLPTPGVGVVGIGGGGTYGGDGAQFFGIGDDGVNGRVGAVGAGAASSSAVTAGGGLYGSGGANSSTGDAGYGVAGVGGAASGVGAAGHGVVGTGGNSTSGTDGYGGLFTAGGTQAIGCAVPATNDFGYTSAKTLYKWILAPNMNGNPLICSFYALSVPNPSYWGNVAGQGVSVDAKVDIPAGAIITDIDVCVSNISGGAEDVTVTLHKISETAYLSYDNFVGTPFVVDGTATLTGGTSGATAKIWADSGTVLTLADVSGTFQNNETIASGAGAGDADGTVSAGPLRAFNVWESSPTSVADSTDRVITSLATNTGSLPQTNPNQDALLYGQCFSISVSTTSHGTADKIKIYGVRVAYTMQKLRQSA